jgi:uncharacterized protein (TIGR03437 family)
MVLTRCGITSVVRIGLFFLLLSQVATSQTATITTVAGNGSPNPSIQDGSSALSSGIPYPFDLDVDAQNNLYFINGGYLIDRVDTNTVYRVSQAGTISRAFTLTPQIASTYAVQAVGISPTGAAYVAVASIFGNSVVRLDSKGQTIVGSNVTYHFPLLQSGGVGLRVYRSGEIIFVADTLSNRIVDIINPDSGNVAAVFAGTGTTGYSGDGGPALKAQFNSPTAVAVDSAGVVYVADTGNHCVRKYPNSGSPVSTVAGICTQAGFSGDTGQAIAAKLSGPSGVAVGPDGTVYISDTGNNRIRRVNPNGSIETIAGIGQATFSNGVPSCFDDPFSPNCFFGDGGVATRAILNGPRGIALDSQGRLYIADSKNNRIRMLSFGPKPSATTPLLADKGVVNAASFAAPVARAGWATIYGSNFTTGAARIWNSSDFSGNNLPTSLDGVSVTFNDKPAALYFFNATQINVQVPDGLPDAEVTVKVTTPGGTAVSGVLHQAIAPGLFTIAQVKASDGTSYSYPAAVHLDGTLVGRPSVLQGSRPATGGEIILVFGTGFGPSNPPQPSGMLIPSTLLNSLVTFTLSGNQTLPQAAALISPGLYQFNVLVPTGLKSGTDYLLQIGFLGGAQSQQGVYLPIN